MLWSILPVVHGAACIVSDVGSQLPWENFDRPGAEFSG